MIQKSQFVRSLQDEEQSLSPHEISQRVRRECGCVSTYQGDPELSVDMYRGYMTRVGEKPDRTPEDPQLFICVVSTQQSKAWQDVIWIKEILQILDPEHARTDTPEKLNQMLDNRLTITPNGTDTPPNVVADKAGFILALGSAVPRAYRDILRGKKFLDRFDVVDLEQLLLIPQEYIPMVLSQDFEEKFESALRHFD